MLPSVPPGFTYFLTSVDYVRHYFSFRPYSCSDRMDSTYSTSRQKLLRSHFTSVRDASQQLVFCCSLVALLVNEPLFQGDTLPSLNLTYIEGINQPPLAPTLLDLLRVSQSLCSRQSFIMNE